LTILVLLVLGTGLYLYSLKCLDAPISAGFRLAITTARLIFLILLLLLLTKPQITEIQKISQFPSLFVAIDDSHSMSYAIDPLSGKNASSRIDLTVDSLRDSLLPTLQKQGYAMRFSLFSSFGDENGNPGWSPHLPQSVQADFGYTDLAAVIASFDRQRNQDHAAYLLLFTDGQWNRGPNPMAVAINPGPGTAGVTQFSDRRIYSFGIGTTRSIFDIMIDQVQFPSLSREQEPLTLTAHVMAKGALPQQPVPIRVQGVSQDQEVVFTQEEFMVFDEENRKQTLEFDIPSLTVGEYVFSVNIDLQEGELFEENNRIDKGIRIRKSKDRVLLFSSAPSRRKIIPSGRP